MSEPNLFEFATSELSQDAFLCWLASWAAPEFRKSHAPLHATACAFLARLLAVGKGPAVPDIRSITVERQVEHIDVLITLNGDTAILIEDKTATCEHSDQLNDYKKALSSRFAPGRIAAVYLKILDQADFARVHEASFGPFLRRYLLDILDQGKRAGVRNDIYADYLARLQRIEDAVQSYRSLPIDAWGSGKASRNCWRGFFIAMQQHLPDGRWDQVDHQGGRSIIFRWHWRDGKFLLLRGERLEFRLEVLEPSERQTKWKQWNRAVLTQAERMGTRLCSSIRREGKRMVVAALVGEYRQSLPDGTLDMEKTVEMLRHIEALMDGALTLL